MGSGFFVTGTDTGVGKTTATLALMAAFQRRGLRVAAMKPVAAGCERSADGLRNDDALRLMAQASVTLPYELVNPYAFEAPIAPHIAAGEQGVEIALPRLQAAYGEIRQRADVVLVEGAGGWLVPIGESGSMADVPAALGLAVINVVGIRLGCINHALLTELAVRQHGCTPVGWIANHLQPDTLRAEQIVQSLQSRLDAPLLGRIGYDAGGPEHTGLGLDIDVLR